MRKTCASGFLSDCPGLWQTSQEVCNSMIMNSFQHQLGYRKMLKYFFFSILSNNLIILIKLTMFLKWHSFLELNMTKIHKDCYTGDCCAAWWPPASHTEGENWLLTSMSAYIHTLPCKHTCTHEHMLTHTKQKCNKWVWWQCKLNPHRPGRLALLLVSRQSSPGRKSLEGSKRSWHLSERKVVDGCLEPTQTLPRPV